MSLHLRLPLGLALCLAPAAHAQLGAGELLVNSLNQAALFHLAPDGTLLQATSGESGFLWEGAGVLPDGRWVSTHRYATPGVGLYDPTSGLELASFDTPAIEIPGDVSVFADGTFLVVDQKGDALWHFADDGTHLGTIALPLGAHPLGTCVDAADEVWVGCLLSQEVRRYDRQGQLLGAFPTGFGAGEVAAAGDGTVWVTDYDTGLVARFAADGALLTTFQGSDFPALALALDLDGTLWVGGGTDDQLHHLAPDGTLLAQIPAPAATVFLTVGRETGPPVGVTYCSPAVPNSTGQPGHLAAFGSDVAAANQLRLEASALPPGRTGMFLVSRSKDYVPFHGGADGHLCLGGPRGAYSTGMTNAGADGALRLDLDLTAVPMPGGPVAVKAGETWHWQCWYRDLPLTSNFTDAVAVTFR